MKNPSIGQVYVYVFLGLVMLTFVTVALAFVNLGWLNPATALLIAGFKALLIVYFFMHLRRTEVLVKVFAFGTLLWLSILLIYTFSDYLSRNWTNYQSIWK